MPVSLIPQADGSTVPFPHMIDRNKPGFIVVNQQGRRFVNEAVSYQDFVEAMQAESAGGKELVTWLIADHRAARKYGMGMLPYFPLASGLLTGKYRRNAPMPAGTRLAGTQRLAERYLTERNWGIAERLGDFVEQRGHTMLELAFSWLLAQAPVTSVIAGATRPEQLEQNVKAGAWVLSAEELAEIDRISAA